MSAYRLAEILGALSLATDSANGVAPQTALRTAVVAAALGRSLGFDDESLHDVYWAALLRFLGCTAFAYEAAHRYGAGDDRALLSAVNPADTARPVDLLRRVAHGLPNTSAAKRALSLARLALDPNPTKALAAAHCELAMTLANRLGVSERVVFALGQIYERHDGHGVPRGLSGDAIEPIAQLSALAFRVVSHFSIEGESAARDVVRSRAGSELEPKLAAAFLAHADDVLRLLSDESVWETFLALEPQPHALTPPAELDRVAEAFADYSDLKSPFTIGHSRGVAVLAAGAASALGLGADAGRLLQSAALLHDLGRVAIPNGIWDKPAQLTQAERSRVEEHAWHTSRILSRSSIFAPFAELAGQAHARADGTGYASGALNAKGDEAARILAASDVLNALEQDRPHRLALEREAAIRVLRGEVSAGRLDARVVDALVSPAAIKAVPVDRSRSGLSERELEVLGLVAIGLSNKEIAARLEISPKTVQHHVAHIYEKTGVGTRAAAAIFAMTHQLLASQ